MNYNRGLSRIVEFALAGVGLLALLPLLAVVFALVRLTSPGPAFFRQKRVGRGGGFFTLYKFRTMRTGISGLAVTAAGDRRITGVGKFLRKTKIDELPQLWNILRGDMKLVGPRPEVPEYVDLTDPLWAEVLRVKPGITDPVTLKLRNEELLMEMVGLDRETFYKRFLQPYKLRGSIEYLQVRTWKTDVYLIWQTLVVIFLPKSVLQPSAEELTKNLVFSGSSVDL